MHAPITGWAFLGFLFLIVAFWAYWALHGSNGSTGPEAALDALRDAASHPAAALAAIPLFIAGSLVIAPVYGMIAVCALVFEPLTAIAAALGGTMVATAVTHWMGVHFGRLVTSRIPASIVSRVQSIGTSADTWSIAGLQCLPIAPFTILNMLVGAAGVSLRVFLAGTFITMVPTVVLICLSVDRARAILRGESIFDPWTVIAIAAAGTALIVLRVWQKRGKL
jgi:phospholipase D1/2